jgi:hypothetical protein
MTSEMELVMDAGGGVRSVYGEELDLRGVEKLQITRASHVEARSGNTTGQCREIEETLLGTNPSPG